MRLLETAGVCLLLAMAASGQSQGPGRDQGIGRRAEPPRSNLRDGLTYVYLPPGQFQMGCSPGDAECSDNERPPRRVTLSKGFWLGESEVTQAAYQRVRKSNPSRFTGSSLPVEMVSWNDASNYCVAIGGRLPTEAEWEYAARGGETAATYGSLAEIAWYGSYAYRDGQTQPVKRRKPNAYGLYDMLGNVWEWTADGYSEAIPGGVDPRVPPAERMSVRGGSWFDRSANLRASRRDGDGPSNRSTLLGFRCAWD